MNKCGDWRSDFSRGIVLAVTVGFLLAGAASAVAQAVDPRVAPASADGKQLAFDVISIREDKAEPSKEHPSSSGSTADGYHMQDLPLFVVIQMAYLQSQGEMAFRPGRIVGVPAWAFYTNSINYDIDAKVSEADLTSWRDPAQQPAMLRAMLQTMLTERFKLVEHREMREAPIYEMTPGRKSPKFKPAEATTLEEIRKRYPDVVTLKNGTYAVTGPEQGQETFLGVTMPELATLLENLAGRPVLDKTGLTGRYDVSYQVESRPPVQADGTSVPVTQEFFSLQIFNIVQDQLGLKLNAAKGPVEFLVIDHVERPSGN